MGKIHITSDNGIIYIQFSNAKPVVLEGQEPKPITDVLLAFTKRDAKKLAVLIMETIKEMNGGVTIGRA